MNISLCKHIDVNNLLFSQAIKEENGFYVSVNNMDNKPLLVQLNNLNIKSINEMTFMFGFDVNSTCPSYDFIDNLDSRITQSLRGIVKIIKMKYKLNNNFTYSPFINSDQNMTLEFNNKHSKIYCDKSEISLVDIMAKYNNNVLLADVYADIIVQPYIYICGDTISSEFILHQIKITDIKRPQVVLSNYCFLDTESDSDNDNVAKSDTESESSDEPHYSSNNSE